MKILIMGLPGSGKSKIARELSLGFDCAWYNADAIRKMANDWDFTMDGRLRQARRMANFADFEKGNGRTVICDFVCPTDLTRYIFDADYTIWMDTIENSRYLDTDLMFTEPEFYDVRITKWIDLNRLYSYLGGGNLGTEATPNFLNELFKKLDK